MKKLFIPINQWKNLDPKLLPGIADRLKIHITPILDNNTHVLSFTDIGNYHMLEDSKYDFIKFYNKETLISLTDKVEMGNLPLSTLKTIVPYCSEDVLGFSEGPVFLKRRRTLIKERSHPLAYSSWDSTTLLDNTKGSELYQQQINSPHPICGEFVLQNKISYPFKEVVISISVNEYSDVLVWNIFKATGISQNNYADNYSENHNKAKYQTLIDKIQSICRSHQIKNSLHSLQFIESETGEYTLIDWNLRPPIDYILFSKAYPILDQPIAHMMGVASINNCTYHHKAEVFSVTGGIYNVKLLPGLFIRPDFIGANLNEIRLKGIAESESELLELFSQFKQLNNLV